MITLLSYNIRFGKNLERIIRWIKKEKSSPDIICFQEFPLNKLDDVSNFLSDTTYAFRFAPSFIKHQVRYGELTAFKSDKLRLVRAEIIDLGYSKLDNFIFRYKSFRSSLITDFVHKKRTFTVINVHLPWLGLQRKRKKHLKIIIETLNHKMPTVIIGDYNYSSLFGTKGLVKFMKNHNFHMAGKRLITHKLWKIPQQVDYAFYRDLKVNTIRVEKVKYSDHYPLFINLGL